MTARLANITIDCDNALVVGRFWSEVLGRPLTGDPEPSEHYSSLAAADGDGGGAPQWLFCKVPEGTLSRLRSQAWQVSLPL